MKSGLVLAIKRIFVPVYASIIIIWVEHFTINDPAITNLGGRAVRDIIVVIVTGAVIVVITRGIVIIRIVVVVIIIIIIIIVIITASDYCAGNEHNRNSHKPQNQTSPSLKHEESSGNSFKIIINTTPKYIGILEPEKL